MKKLLFAIVLLLLFTRLGYSQDTQKIISEAAQIYTGSQSSPDNTILGFSVAGLLGGILFSSIGFIAFIYGKRNAEYKPMTIGILLMGYMYFVKNTVALFSIGIILSIILFVWRE